MIYALQFNITAGTLDGTTLVNLALPVADDATGIMQIAVAGNFGGVDPAMLAPLVGGGGYMLAGIGLQVGGAGTQNVTAGMVGRTAGSVNQRFQGFTPFVAVLAAGQPPYAEVRTYIPPFYRLFVAAPGAGAQNHVVRLDIAPISGPAQAARALRANRPTLLSPVAFP